MNWHHQPVSMSTSMSLLWREEDDDGKRWKKHFHFIHVLSPFTISIRFNWKWHHFRSYKRWDERMKIFVDTHTSRQLHDFWLFLPSFQVMISFKIDKQLQTISNYFLFSLAIADLAIGLISMPLFTVSTILGHWPLGPVVCDTWLALDYLASNASVLNLLIISFDRYFSVTRPLTYRAKRTTNRAAFMIASAWGISLLLWPPWIYSWPYIEGWY